MNNQWNDQNQLLRSSAFIDVDMNAIYRNKALLKNDLNVRAAFDMVVSRIFSDTVRFKEANEIIELLGDHISPEFTKNGFERFTNVEWQKFMIDCLEWTWIAGFVPVTFINHDQFGSIPCCLSADMIHIQMRMHAAGQFDFRYRSIVCAVRPEEEERLNRFQTVDSFKGAASVGTGRPRMEAPAKKSHSKAAAAKAKPKKQKRAEPSPKRQKQEAPPGGIDSTADESDSDSSDDEQTEGEYHEHDAEVDGPIMGDQDINEVRTFVFDNPTVSGQPTSVLQTLNWEIDAWLNKLRMYKVQSAREMTTQDVLISTAIQKDLLALANSAGEALGASRLMSDARFGHRAGEGDGKKDSFRDEMAVMSTMLERQVAAVQEVYERLSNIGGGGRRGGGAVGAAGIDQNMPWPKEAPRLPNGAASSSDSLRMRNLGPEDKAAFVPRHDAVPDFKEVEALRQHMVGKATRVPEVLWSPQEANKTRAQSVGSDNPAQKMFAATCMDMSKKIAFIAEECFARIYHEELAMLVADSTDSPAAARLAMYTKRVNLVFDGNVEPAAVEKLLDMGALSWKSAVTTFARKFGIPVDEILEKPVIPDVTSLGFEKGLMQAQMEFEMANEQAEAAAQSSARHTPPKPAAGGESKNGTPSIQSGKTVPLVTDKRSQLFNSKFIANNLGPTNKLASDDAQRDRRSIHNKYAARKGGRKRSQKRKRENALTRPRRM
jgi:hypothetical protein